MYLAEHLSKLAGKDITIFNYWSGLEGGFLFWWMEGDKEFAYELHHSLPCQNNEECTMERLVEVAEQAIKDNRPLFAADNPKKLEIGFILLGSKEGTTTRYSLRLHGQRQVPRNWKQGWTKHDHPSMI